MILWPDTCRYILLPSEMAFIFSLIYLTLTYLSPSTLFPSLAPLHIQLWIGMLAMAGSVAVAASGHFPFKARQVQLMLGLVIAIAVSHLAHLWLNGAIAAMQDFLAAGIAFFTIIASVRTTARVRTVFATITLVALYLLTRSVIAYLSGSNEELYVLRQVLSFDPTTAEPLLFIDRIRSVGFLNDPNDFGQFLLVVIPFVFLLWRPHSLFRNISAVILPASFVAYGVFLTRSRGAMIGLVATAAFGMATRVRKSVLVGGAALGLLVVIAASQGQRDISTHDESALGRLDAWGTGLAMLKSSPLFGTGYNTFLDHNELTAHNSYVLCFSELGVVGYFFWLALIVLTSMQLNRASGDSHSGDGEVARLSHAVRVSLFAYLITSWFLSRTYTVTLYLLIGLGASLFLMSSETADQKQAGETIPWARTTLAVEAASIALVYLFARARGM